MELNKINAQTIAGILTQMQHCLDEQESIVLEEREALQTFDAKTLTDLVERRARSQSMLHELESQCAMLCHQLPSTITDKTMSAAIAYYADAQADDLQHMRIELMRRMQALGQDHVENHIRLRAAWNVTTNILQQIGAVEASPTYSNTTYTQQVAR